MSPSEDVGQPEDERSLAQLEAGGIPPSAERRLGELRSSGGSYTSDLSIADLALCSQLGLRPLSQVMGSSIYQVGYQEATLGFGFGGALALGGGYIAEMDTLSRAWNEARELALGRLAREAQAVDADAVVGVRLTAAARDTGEALGSGVIEYSVLGTAVRRTESNRQARAHGPVLTELTVSEYAKLVGAGFAPAGIVGWSSVFFARYAFGNVLRLEPGILTPVQSFELREFTQGFYAAREQVMARTGEQAKRLGAHGIVGVRISHDAHPMAAGTSQSGIAATFHAIGTAVREREHVQPPTPKTTIDLST